MGKSTPPPSAAKGKRRRTGGTSASSSSEKKKKKLSAASTASTATTKGSATSRRGKKERRKVEEFLPSSSSSSEEEDYDPKPKPRRRKKKLDISYEDTSSFDDDDSSYSEDDNAKEEEKDEDDSYKSISDASSSSSSSSPNNNNTQRRSYSPSTILNARVKIISGQYKGKKGTVIDVNRGWYTLDKRSGVPSAVRARELQVTRYATATSSSTATTKQEETGEEEQADDNDVQFVNNGYEVSSTTHGDLTGATVRINSGKFEGLQGMINERRSFMHVKIDVDPPMDPLHISDVTIIQHPNKNAYMEDDIFLPTTSASATTSTETVEPNTDEEKLDMLSKQYIGSKVKVLPHHENAGTIGTVKQVLVGDWYITNNPLISNAYRVDKFDILEYPRGYVKPKIEESGNTKNDEEEEVEEEVGSVEEEEEEETDVKKKPAAVGKSNEEDDINEEEDINEDDEAADETNNRVGTPPPLAAAPADATSPEVPLTPTGRQSLLGARIRIKRGRYQGLEGTVTEKRTIRCLEIDTLPHNPFRFEDVTVLEYADNSSLLQESSTSSSGENRNNNGGPPDVFAQHYQRYMGATVKVNENFDLPEDAGTVGKVMKVFVLGDWYITDNPDIPNAFQEAKFDILSYPSGYVLEEEGEEGEETRSRDDDEDGMYEDKPTASKEKGGEVVDDEKDNDEDWGDQTGGDVDPDSSKVDDQKMDDNEEEKGEGEVKQNPLHGATIYVSYGPMKGSMGKLLMAEQRGWWIVEGFERKVQSSNCKIVDDGNADIEKIKKHYSDMYKGKRSNRIPRIIQPESLIKGEKGGMAGEKEYAVDAGMNMDVEDEYGSYKRKVSGTDFTGKDHNKRMKELGVIYHQQEGGFNSMFGSRKWAGQHRPKVRDNTPMLNPVLLQSSVEQKKEGDDDDYQLVVQLLPTSLRHLPPDTKIEIFNRRTGKIMKGNDAISMKNLPRELLEHAEYEPIIPPLSGESSITSRMGRSGSNVRINRNVIPQSRVWASKHEGRQVMVTGGENRGLTGTVDSCIPGGWYCISGLFNKDSNNVVINSNNLELIPAKAAESNTTSTSSKDLEKTKIRLHLRAAKLRLDFYTEEGEKEKHANPNVDEARMKKLDKNISSTLEQIDNFQRMLNQFTPS